MEAVGALQTDTIGTEETFADSSVMVELWLK